MVLHNTDECNGSKIFYSVTVNPMFKMTSVH